MLVMVQQFDILLLARVGNRRALVLLAALLLFIVTCFCPRGDWGWGVV